MDRDSDWMDNAAELIWESWQSGNVLSGLPNDLRPTTRLEAYKIQFKYARYSKKPVFGWKIAATSAAGQAHIGVSGPIAGMLICERVFGSAARLSIENNRMAVAEAEFAFRMGETLMPRQTPYDQEEVMSAVQGLYPAIEIPNSRFLNFETIGEEQLIADNACAHEFIIGAEIPKFWRKADLSKHQVSISTGPMSVNQGVGGNVLGDPRVALTWLINELSQNEMTIDAGMMVTTGSCTVPITIGAGDEVIADFGGFGSVNVSFEN